MRRIYYVLLFCLSGTLATAQSHPKTKALSDRIASAMCHCMNDAFHGIDEDIRYLIVNAVSDPENGSMIIQQYLAEAGEEKSQQVLLQLQKLGSIESDLTICFEAATQKIQNLEVETEDLQEHEQKLVALDFESEEKTIALLLNSMHQQNDCELAYRFIKLGLDLKQK